MSPTSSTFGVALVERDSRTQEVLCAQVQLLYANAAVSAGVTIFVATILSYLQWGLVPNRVVLAWWAYMVLVAASRSALAQRYHRAIQGTYVSQWRNAFTVGTALAGMGWGAAGVLLCPESALSNQVFLVFVLGGMMLGGGSLLAPRPEAFLTFMIPTGLAPAVRLVLDGGQTHLAMGTLAAVFTLATLITTGRVYRTIDTSLRLQFENHELVVDLQAARSQAEALNEALELRVQERTAELQQSTELLRAEVTQRQQIEEELFRARKLESLGVLAGGIAHDFNNFLTIVQGNIEVAKKAIETGDAVQDLLDQAASTCQRAASLSSKLLTFAKGGAPVRQVVSIAKLVTDSVDLACAGAPMSIAVDIAPDLRFAEVDPNQISQVLHNLLVNAREATPESGIIEVRVQNVEFPSCPANDPRVRISIRDNGCGIAADVLTKIFDPYFTTKPGQSGLGLATAHSIVSRHDGHISVESKPGEGTVFRIELHASLESPAPEAPIVSEVQTGTERILVMDDEEGLRKLIKRVLSSCGYEVQTARDGAEAIAFYEAGMTAGKRFDAVVLDLTVSGGMGGLETAAKLKAMDPSSKLIVSSGYSDKSVMSDFGRYGFDAGIAKPWTSEQVRAVIRRVLDFNPDRKAG